MLESDDDDEREEAGVTEMLVGRKEKRPKAEEHEEAEGAAAELEGVEDKVKGVGLCSVAGFLLNRERKGVLGELGAEMLCLRSLIVGRIPRFSFCFSMEVEGEEEMWSEDRGTSKFVRCNVVSSSSSLLSSLLSSSSSISSFSLVSSSLSSSSSSFRAFSRASATDEANLTCIEDTLSRKGCSECMCVRTMVSA